MARDKPIPIANAAEVPTDGSGTPGASLFRMWMGAGYITEVYVWAGSFDDAFEAMVEWADEHAPGMLVDLTEADLKAVATDLDIEWQPDWPDFEDRDFEAVVSAAESDLTLIGHTTLTHGQYIASHEWGGDEVTDEATIEEVARRSLKEAWGHDFLEGDEVIWKGHDEGDGDHYVVAGVNGDDIDLDEVGDDSSYVNVPASEIAHA